MPDSASQTFLRELDKKLWTAAAKLPAGPEILGERTRLACSDGRPAGRSSSSKPYKITSTGKLIDDALEARN